MYKRLFVVSVFVIFATLPMSDLLAQKKEGPKDPPKKEEVKKDVKPPVVTKAGEPKPYDEVIPKTAKSQPGVFVVHKVDEKIYFEIPKDGFDKLMLWQAEVVKGP